jgi:hypothetical protein
MRVIPLCLGLGFESLLAMGLVFCSVFVPQRLESVDRYWVTQIELPRITSSLKPAPHAKSVKRMAFESVINKLKFNNSAITVRVPRPSTPYKDIPVPEAINAVKVFPNQPQLISVGGSELPILKKPREGIQTGGFGNPDGLPDNGNLHRARNVAQLGSYSLPAGSGYGNGAGNTEGTKEIVAESRFAPGIADAVPTHGDHGTVKQGVFVDVHSGVSTQAGKPATASNSKPVEILYKPKPIYTDLGVSHKVEGEVILEVVFAASGIVEVQCLVKRLGFGLDESAEAATRQIVFKPMQQDGRPVDAAASVHVIFQLAY